MDLNYHHLMYFWAVARGGSIARASEEMLVSQPTISAQVKELEEALGERLFTRSGRRLVLTEVGRTAYDYANEIFGLGRQLVDAVKQTPTGRPLRLAVGVSEAMPKLVARLLIEPALRAEGRPVHLVCREDRGERLLADLATFRLDVILSDSPAVPSTGVRTFSHLLGECGVTFFALPAAARKLRKGFPKSLQDAPAVLPTDNTWLRRGIDQWLSSRGIQPRVVAEVEDSALLKTFGQSGLGVFPAPSVVEAEVCGQYGVAVVARVEEVHERFYAISVERKLRHPAVVAISEAARHELFRKTP